MQLWRRALRTGRGLSTSSKAHGKVVCACGAVVANTTATGYNNPGPTAANRKKQMALALCVAAAARSIESEGAAVPIGAQEPALHQSPTPLSALPLGLCDSCVVSKRDAWHGLLCDSCYTTLRANDTRLDSIRDEGGRVGHQRLMASCKDAKWAGNNNSLVSPSITVVCDIDWQNYRSQMSDARGGRRDPKKRTVQATRIHGHPKREMSEGNILYKQGAEEAQRFCRMCSSGRKR